MTDLLDQIKLEEDRKRWNRTIAMFDDTIEKCERCGGPIEEKMVSNPVTDSVDYYGVCKNPDCPIYEN